MSCDFCHALLLGSHAPPPHPSGSHELLSGGGGIRADRGGAAESRNRKHAVAGGLAGSFSERILWCAGLCRFRPQARLTIDGMKTSANGGGGPLGRRGPAWPPSPTL